MQAEKSTVASLREQIELEYQAMKRGVEGLAAVTRHDFIRKRYKCVDECKQQLETAIGAEEAIKVVFEMAEKYS